MRTKRAIWLTLLCVALGGALFASQVTAQSGLPDEECHSVTVGDILVQTMGSGFDGGMYEGGGWGHESGIKFSLALSQPRRISYISWQWTLVGNSYSEPVVGFSYENGDTFGGFYLQGENATGTWRSHEWIGPSGDASASWWLYFFSAAPDADDWLYIQDLYVCTIPASGSATSTPTATIDLNSPAPHWSYCPLLGARSTFGEGWQMTGGAALNTAPGNRGLYLPGGGQATTSLSLSPSKRYSVYIAYTAGASPPGSTASPTAIAGTPTEPPPTVPAGLFFGWRIEGGTGTGWQIIEIPQAAGIQSFTSPLASYAPMPAGGYALSLNNPSSNANGTPLIQYVCVSEERTGGGGSGTGGGSQGSNADLAACHACDDPQGLWDIQGIVNWIICKIGQFLECSIAGFLRGLWEGLVTLITGVFAFFKWLGDSLGALGGWAGSGVTAVASVAGGQVSNVITSVGNGMHDSGLANGMNIVSSGVRDLPTALLNIVNQGGEIISGTFQSATNLLDILIGMVNLVISTLVSLLAIVPLIFQELADGFNHAAEPVSGSITCTNPGTLLWLPCYGFYVLDNTIFQGPALYLLPILMGMLAFDTFIWALNKIKDAFQ